MGKVTFKNQPKGTATTSKVITDKKTGNVISEDHAIEPVQMPGTEGMQFAEATLAPFVPYAEVGYAAGFTKGMANFSSARVDITIKLPAQVDDIDEVYTFAEEWVGSRLQKQYEEL